MLFRGARLLDESGAVEDGWLLISDGSIRRIGSGYVPSELAERVPPKNVVDVAGATLTPGLIDLHCHGGGGFSYDGSVDDILDAFAVHRAHGTTRSVISLVSAPLEELARSVAAVEQAQARESGVLGAHLEGPFVAPGRRGAHDPHHLIEPTAKAVATVAGWAQTVRQITIAPEIPGGLEAVTALTDAGIVVALGHTEATYEMARKGFDRGATLLTHAFNAMAPIHHREPGPLVAAIHDPRVTIELILDGVHVHPAVAGMLLRSASGRVALISDAMAAADAADGNYRLGPLNVTVDSGIATLEGGALAGSTLTLDNALQLCLLLGPSGIDEPAAVAAMTAVPARAIGEGQRLGLLAPGYAADVVWWTPEGRVHRVWVDGIERSEAL